MTAISIFSKEKRATLAIPLIIFIIALCLRFWFLLEFKNLPFFSTLQLDSGNYYSWARRIASGDLAGGTTAYWVSPFYAYLIAIFHFVSDSSANLLVRLFQIVLGAFTCVLVYSMGEKRFGRRAGIIGALMLSFYSFSIYMDAELLKNSLAAFTLTASLALICCRSQDLRVLFFAGLLLGVTIVNMPNVLLVTPAIMLFPLTDSRPLLKRLLAALCICFGMFLMILPVTARNWAVEKDFVLISYMGGYAFSYTNNTASDGGVNFGFKGNLFTLDVDKEAYTARTVAETSVGRPMKSSEISAWWFNLGKEHIRDYPLSVLALTLKKTAMFWNGYEVQDNIDFYFIKEWSSLLRQPLVSFGFIAPLALFGIISALRTGKSEFICDTAIVISFMISIVLFAVIGRYRLPIVPLLCVYAGYGVNSMFDRLRGSFKSYLPGVIMLLLLAIACNITIFSPNTTHTQKMLADVYKKQNKFKEAADVYRNIITEYPHKFDVQLRLRYAYSLEMSGRLNEAIAQYETALSQSTGMPLAVDIRMVLNDLYEERQRKP